MQALALAAFAALTLLVFLAPSAQAAGTVQLTIEARDSGCPSGKTYCFVVTQGSLADLKGGVSAALTFVNKGKVPHELKVLRAADADPAHQATNEEKAIASSKEDMPAGASDLLNFTVPADATGVYVFCGVSGHEAAGMWLDGTASTKGSPGLDLAFVAVGVLALAALRRR